MRRGWWGGWRFEQWENSHGLHTVNRHDLHAKITESSDQTQMPEGKQTRGLLKLHRHHPSLYTENVSLNQAFVICIEDWVALTEYNRQYFQNKCQQKKKKRKTAVAKQKVLNLEDCT